MKNFIKLSAAAAALIAGVHATNAQALFDNQCEKTIPSSGNVNASCDPARADLLAFLNLVDNSSGAGTNYSYKIRIDDGSTAIGVLLDINGDRVLRAASQGGGQCPSCNDGPGVDANFGLVRSCTLATPDNAKVFRIGMTG